MNYIQLKLLPTEITIAFFYNQKQQSSEQHISFSTFDLVETIPLLVQKISAVPHSFCGAILLDPVPEFQQMYPDYSVALLIKEFSEQLNLPTLTEAEFAHTTDLNEAFQKKHEELTWYLDYFGYTPGKKEYDTESLLTIGNGFIGLRGTLPEMTISDNTYPATYLAGFYNKAMSEINGQKIVNEDFVNAPNAQYFSLKIGDHGEWLDIDQVTIRSLHRRLHLKTGLFSSTMIIEDAQQRRIKIIAQKIVSMKKMNQYSMQYIIEPLNFSQPLTIKSMIDGHVHNYNVERYRNLTSNHLTVTEMNATDNQALMTVKTKQSAIELTQTTRITGDFFDTSSIKNHINQQQIEQLIPCEGKQNQRYCLEKQVYIDMSTIQQKSAPQLDQSFADSYQESALVWENLWEKTDIQLTGDLMSQKLLRLHNYHLLVSASPCSNPYLDASITARGLHGEAYRGHIFWDEIFILPFYIMHFPETAKHLLMYRYKRLTKAKEHARHHGYEGAMYPWQSGLDGGEETPSIHLNPLNGQWGEDHSTLQRHVSLAIAYNIWLYWENTRDQTFMEAYGIEMLLEIANFWKSAAVYDPQQKKYFIDHVMGPDEFHEGYPHHSQAGLKNNAYTNLMVVWLFEELKAILTTLTPEKKQALLTKTAISSKQLDEMDHIQHQLEIEINADGIIAQFEGYFQLKEVDWDQARAQYQNIYRMDRILKAEGKSPNAYKVAKQADTLMLFYNFNKKRINTIFADLHYHLPENYLEKNLHYYLVRTSHGSTLSRIVHAQLAAQVNQQELSWQLYQEALYSDYHDIQGGTTAEGIHTGVMGATIYVTLMTYAGIDIRDEYVTITPNLPKKWHNLTFKLTKHAVDYQFAITKNTIKVIASKPVKIVVLGMDYTLTANEPLQINY